MRKGGDFARRRGRWTRRILPALTLAMVAAFTFSVPSASAGYQKYRAQDGYQLYVFDYGHAKYLSQNKGDIMKVKGSVKLCTKMKILKITNNVNAACVAYKALTKANLEVQFNLFKETVQISKDRGKHYCAVLQLGPNGLPGGRVATPVPVLDSAGNVAGRGVIQADLATGTDVKLGNGQIVHVYCPEEWT